ncbi:MAG: patatin-like phospholipase family protein [Pseudorhodoplanes sp.]|jgi:predicted acylesterase/phospholipase RssA|nr:patatin-like phospholipase family protein [Pseudorhodoplanes sp.]
MNRRENLQKKEKMTALFLGGGAPNFTLMSGALLALHQKGIRFDIISMAGAGAVVGLMYVSPKGLTAEQALENTVNFGISDQIYAMFPVNYKTFTKWGRSADEFNAYWFNLPQVQAAAHQYGMSPEEKLRADWLLFLGAMLCPSDLTYASLGLCEHPHFIDNLIDFDNLPNVEQDIEVNAFRLRDQTVVDFSKDVITPDHLRAALSFPFIYPPHKIGDEYYYEGAAFQCINPARLNPEIIDHFVVLQPMASQQIRSPRNLWDAYAQSVMMPVAALAQYGTEVVKDAAILDIDEQLIATVARISKRKIEKKEYSTVCGLAKDAIAYAQKRRLDEAAVCKPGGCVPLSSLFPQVQDRWYEAKFDIDPDRLPFVFDWSRSNLEYLFDLGYVTGEDLADELIAEGWTP